MGKLRFAVRTAQGCVLAAMIAACGDDTGGAGGSGGSGGEGGASSGGAGGSGGVIDETCHFELVEDAADCPAGCDDVIAAGSGEHAMCTIACEADEDCGDAGEGHELYCSDLCRFSCVSPATCPTGMLCDQNTLPCRAE